MAPTELYALNHNYLGSYFPRFLIRFFGVRIPRSDKPVRAEERLTSSELTRPLVRQSRIHIARADINCYDRVAIRIEYDSEIRLDFGGVNDATIASGKLFGSCARRGVNRMDFV